MTGVEDYKLDWIPRHDPRSLQYPIRAIVDRTTPVNMTWRTPAVPLDQGREGACVGFGWTHEALTTPVAVDFARVRASVPRDPAEFARYCYLSAQRIDEWEGENYEGTSVLAGAKVMRQAGLLLEYRWCFSTKDVAMALSNTGPVVLGIPWYDSMYYPVGNICRVGGDLVGGHCIIVTKYRRKGVIFEDEAAFGLFNSWGPDWGHNGHAWVKESDLAFLLRQDGEACVPVRRSYGR